MGEITQDQETSNIKLRMSVRAKVSAWSDLYKMERANLFASLFDYVDYDDLMRAHDRGDPHLWGILTALNGSNGYTIWRALLAKRGMQDA